MVDLQPADLSQRRACPLGSEDLASPRPESARGLESLGFWGGPESAGRGCFRGGGPEESCRGRCHDRSRQALVSGSDARPLLWSAAGRTQPGPPPRVPPSLARPSPAPSAALFLSLLFRESSPPSGPRTRVRRARSPVGRAAETPGSPWARPGAGEARPPPTGAGQRRGRGPEDGTS